LIRFLISHDVFKSCIRFPVARGQDKNAAAKLLVFEYSDKLTETKRRTLDQFTRDAKREPKNRLELASRRIIDTLDRMSEVFLPRDLLLGSAGILPVYYWFIRQRKTKDDPVIREFLVDFERQRKANRGLVSNPQSGKTPDSEFIEYDGFNRNTNDVSSYQGRVAILEKRFARYQTSKQ
jgi:hypothetical protein